MKTKKLFFIIGLFLFQSQTAFNQCINIDLSVKWETGFDIFRDDSAVCVPKLCITYRNNSSNNYYFLKVSNSRFGYPMLPWGTLLQYPIEEYLNPDYLKRAKLHGNYTNQNYNVIIGGSPLFSRSWIVYNDTLNSEIEHEIDMINDDLADIYEYMYRNQADSIEFTKPYFSVSDVNGEMILDVNKGKFVFLKSGEAFTDVYNIVGFKIIQGNFTFYIDPNSLTDYVNTDPVWDSNQLKYIEVKTALPKKVGEYKLYYGNFNTNKITITF